MPELMEVRYRWNILEQWNGKSWKRVGHAKEEEIESKREPEPEFFPYGSKSDVMDDVACLLNGKAKRCAGCKRPTLNQYLKSGKCPVCRDTTSQERGATDYGSNGGTRCDTFSGPCSCGAWH